MTDAEIIIQLLRIVEWRLRANRLLHELTLSLSIVLIFLIALKVWDLLSPLKAATIPFVIAACAFLFTSYAVWRFRKKGTPDQAAVSIDRKAGLNDEIKTAFWFIENRRPSEWVDTQIQRAARNAMKIDVRRAYPCIIPRSSYAVAAMILAFVGLNFAPLPLNHNWLMLRPAPKLGAEQTNSLNSSILFRKAGSLDLQSIDAGLKEIAAHLQESEKLRGVGEALMEKRLDRAAEELRKLGAQMKESPQSMRDIEESLQAAARNAREGLEPLTEDLAEAAHAIQNKDVAGVQEALEDIAQDLEDLEEEIYTPESTLDQSARGNERKAEQDGHVSGAPIPQARDFAQATSSTEGLGASGGNAEAGPRHGAPTTLAVKLQQERLRGMLSRGTARVDVEQASRQERSKLDYRNARSELTAAQKDVLNRDSMPWKYRPLIKSYFQTMPEP
jgi:cell division septum initiation protein DivIVA